MAGLFLAALDFFEARLEAEDGRGVGGLEGGALGGEGLLELARTGGGGGVVGRRDLADAGLVVVGLFTPTLGLGTGLVCRVDEVTVLLTEAGHHVGQQGEVPRGGRRGRRDGRGGRGVVGSVR